MTDQTPPLYRRAIAHIGSRLLAFLTGSKPHKIESQNGVAVRNKWIGHPTDVSPRYEQELIAGIRETVRPSDRIAVVGAHHGVSSVVAARHTEGGSGEVCAFEAEDAAIDKILETLSLNKVEGKVSVHHAVVEVAKDVYGDFSGADDIDADELPECDVLVMDCEGAESEILQNMTQRPRNIIVETHGRFDAPTETIESLLQEAGYEIVSVTPVDDIEENQEDIDVIVAER